MVHNGSSKEKILAEIGKCTVLCSNCHKKFHWDHPEHRSQRRPPTGVKPQRDELEKLLWEKPTTHIALEYGVSDKAVEKWAASYGLEKPPRGFWSKIKPQSV